MERPVALGNQDTKYGMRLDWYIVKLPRDGGIHHRAGVFQVHTFTYAERPADPSGVDQITFHIVASRRSPSIFA